MNKTLKKALASLAVVIGLVASLSLGFLNSAQADSGYFNKGMLSALISCYDAGQFKSPVKASVFSSSTVSNVNKFMAGNQKVYVPIGYNGETVQTGCSDLVGTLINNSGVSIPNGSSTAADINNFMTSLGYTTKSTPGNGECFSFRYIKTYDWIDPNTPDTDETLLTQKVCADVINSDGTIGVDKLRIVDGDESIIQFQKNQEGSIEIDCAIGTLGLGGCGKHTFTAGSTKWSEFKEEIRQDIVQNKGSGSDVHPMLGYIVSYKLDGLDTGEVTVNNDTVANMTAEYTIDSGSANAKAKGTGTLLGSATNAKPAFSDDDTFALYQAYLNNFYGADTRCGLSDDQALSMTGNGYKKINYCSGGKTQVCYTRALKHNNESVGGVSGGIFGSDCNFDCVTDWLSNYSGNTCPAEETSDNSSDYSGNTATPNDPGTAGDNVNLTEDSIVDCNELTTIGAMQWILCPTMNNMQYATSWIDNMTQDWLQVDTSLYDGGSVDTIWGIIRNIANVVMVIILLVIIFSQLTGYGIDNYGIKKMLPRLIVMAIVINLSLYICQLAVDASNIFGSGLRDMFGSITGASSKPGESFLSGMITGLFATANAGGAVAVGTGVTLASLGAPIAIAVVIAVIVLLLVILVAVIVLFLMLGAREIIVILCVVISPLAFAAYILPNTQNLYKKWWELFKAALIIFPICGAMSGISVMLRGLSEGAELHMWGYAILMILPYLGFFLMPMLLKNAISALGKVGGALTAMGQTFRGGGRAIGQGAMSVAKNTEAYKNIQNDALRKRQSDSADRTIARLQQIRDEGGQLTDAQTRRLARAQETKRKLANEDTAARTILTEREYANSSMGDLLNDWNRAFDSGDTDTMDALTNVIVSRHGPGGTNAIAQQLANKTIFGADGNFISADSEASFNALRANMMQNSTLANTMQSKASDAYQMVMNGGYYEGDNGVSQRGNLAEHSAHNAMATQTKDWASQSTATLRRAVDAGALTAEDAKNILNSTDPAVQSGIQSDKAKREVLQAAADGYRSGHNGNWGQDTVQQNGQNMQASSLRAANYRNSVASANQAELDVRAADRAQTAQMASAVQQIANNFQNLPNTPLRSGRNDDTMNFGQRPTGGQNNRNEETPRGTGIPRDGVTPTLPGPTEQSSSNTPRLPGPTVQDSNNAPRLPGPTAQ